MLLQEQVTSLALSEQLFKLGVSQESLFFWANGLANNYHLVYIAGDKAILPRWRGDSYSAFTVAELGELLPRCYMSWATPQNGEMRWWCRRMESHFVTHEETPTFTAATEADARAKMLIYLLEQKSVTREEIQRAATEAYDMVGGYCEIFTGQDWQRTYIVEVEKNDKDPYKARVDVIAPGSGSRAPAITLRGTEIVTRLRLYTEESEETKLLEEAEEQ